MILCKTGTAPRAVSRALGALAATLACGVAAAATITVNSTADDVFVNVAGAIFSDATYTTPVVLASPKCTLRMALAAANMDTAIGGANGCTAGSGIDTITIPATGTIKLSQVAMEPVIVPPPPTPPATPYTWLLFSAGNVTINGPGSTSLTINGGGLAPGSVGLRAMLVSNADAATDAPTTITNVSIKEGRSVAVIAASGGATGGCLFSRESLTLTNVVFEGCESAGVGDGVSNFSVGGGALGMGAALSTDSRPNAVLNNVRFVGNRTVHGTANAATVSTGGAATLGVGTALWMGSVSISNSWFSSNSAESVGALRITNASSVSISSTPFVSNSATTGTDGAFNIANVTGTVTISGGGAISNTAALRRGAGQISTVGVSLTPTDDAITMSDWSAIGNVAAAQDIGGLSILPDTFDVSGNCNFGQLRSVRLTNVYFEKNLATQNRGGLRVGCGANLVVNGAEFIGNEVSGDTTANSGGNGAAQIHDMGSVTMTDVTISNNKTYAGTTTGGYNVFTILGHPSSGSVPAVFPSIGATHAVTLTNIRVRDNWAQSGFPGIVFRANAAGRNYELTNSSFTGNTSPNAPYGLFFETVGNYTIRNSTFSGNYSTGTGGPALGFNTLAPTGTLQVLLENITSARNGPNSNAFDVAAYGGSTYSANTVVRNSIFGQYQFGAGPFPVSLNTTAGLTYSFTNSIVENGGGLPAGICGANNVVCGLDAKLEGLNYNGGFAGTFTHALRPGSPALNAGVAVTATTDQRGAGFPRVIGSAVDIGAFESTALAAVLPCKLDMDGDNQVAATKEGLVILRSMLGLSEATSVAGTGITQPQWNATRLNLNANCGTNFTP